jgi:hypothetical protein
MLALTMSRKYALSLVFGTGWKHASAHLRWQVTGDRLPAVWPAMGSRCRRGTPRTASRSSVVDMGEPPSRVGAPTVPGSRIGQNGRRMTTA